MQKNPLHIVSFDNPYPPVYGGVIDVFYKVKALSLHFDIYLHCIVDSNQSPAAELKDIAREVYFYRRHKKRSFLKLFSNIPFAAISRYNRILADNLKNIDAPILFEGLQTTFLLKKHDFSDRKLLLRLHNLESKYFAGSHQSETNFFKKWLYASEAKKYKSYEQIMGRFDLVLTLSVFETQFVQMHFGNAVYIPVFHGNDNEADLSEFGRYALYHGDLRLPDNKRAARFLVDVFSEIRDYELVIASGTGQKFVEDLTLNLPHISFMKIQDQPHLDTLLRDAHLNVMLSFQQSGTKLKLVNALYKSRFCIINHNMVDDPKIQDLCTRAESKTDFINAVNRLKSIPFNDFENREAMLKKVLDDAENASKIKTILTS